MELNKRFLSFVVLAAVLMTGFSAKAEEIQFSEDELPVEAITPKLDTPKAVLNRKLSYKSRFQADLSYGWLLDEAFYNNQFFGVQGSYGFDEASGFGIRYLVFGSGLSDYSKQFSTGVTNPPNFNQAPGPKNGFMGFYERRMMYGKLSLGKHRVITALLNWNAEAGMISYGSRSLPLIGASLGNRFFLSPNFGISLGLHGYLRQLVDPLSQNLRTGTTHSESDFKTTTKLSTMLDLSLCYLF